MSAFDPDAIVPADGPDILPDDELAAALEARDAAQAVGAPRPFGRGWAFDFAKGDFIFHGQGPARVTDVAQLKVWMEKALRTARFAHPIYGDDFGLDTVDLIGRPLTSDLVGSYAEAVEDALLAHDRITAVEDFTFTKAPDSEVLEVSFTVIVDEGAESIELTTAITTGGL